MISAEREDTTDLSDALLGLIRVPADKAKEMRWNDEIHNIVDDRLNTNAPGLPAISSIATRPKRFIKVTKAEFLTKQ